MLIGNTKEVCYFIWGNIPIYFVNEDEKLLFILV